MLIDTHAHINFKPFKDDGHDIIRQSLEKGVWMINVGSQYSTSERAVFEYAEKYQEGVYAAVGLHPLHLAEVEIKEKIYSEQSRTIESEKIKFKTRTEEFDREKYENLACHSKVLAIGEIGFDNKSAASFEAQKKTFLDQLQLAEDIKKPVIIHCRGYHDELIEILKSAQINTDKKQIDTNKKGVIHFFSGNWAQAQEYFNLGFLISFTGVITYAKDWDKVIKNAPLEKIMVETDCPYVAPQPHRGERNLPYYVEYIARKIAEIKGLSFDEVAEQTTKNARKLFGV